MQYFFVYILKCSDSSYYVGHTDDLEKRMIEHQEGKIDGYTASRLPLSLMYSETFESRDEAFLIEQRIKKWSRRKKEALIAGDFAALKQHAKKDFKKNKQI